MRIECPPEQARAWFSGLLDHVTTAEPWKEGKPLTTLNVAVTAGGLRALGVSEDVVEGSPRSSAGDGRARGAPRRRRRQRAERLGQGIRHRRRARAPDDQRAGEGGPRARARQDARRDGRRRRPADRRPAGHRAARGCARALRLRGRLRPAGGRGLQRREGARGRRARGGRAGARSRRASSCLATPTRTRATTPSAGCPTRRPTRSARAGRTWSGASSTRTSRCGGVLADAAKLYKGGDEQMLAAKVVGRWPDGTPLVTHPEKPDPDFDAAARGANDFRYSGDLDGRRCPIGSHIRRCNPRDALGSRAADVPPPHDPPRHAVRRPAARRRVEDDSTDAGSSSCASRRASRASSRRSRCSG